MCSGDHAGTRRITLPAPSKTLANLVHSHLPADPPHLIFTLQMDNVALRSLRARSRIFKRGLLLIHF